MKTQGTCCLTPETMIPPKCGLPEGGGSVHAFCRNASIPWQPRQDVSDKNNLGFENAGACTYQ